ncbi:MAG: type III-A CRISPR-associated protein Csm2 [Bryobacteraceae bacterium]|nr:type III-A CRISPR-associated protein Csm2 [Solibacteraceae bacterium]MCO5351249.1 type III-A CRISPR-associated protein Csm2 [Bryobacteraceae bacterium]
MSELENEVQQPREPEAPEAAPPAPPAETPAPAPAEAPAEVPAAAEAAPEAPAEPAAPVAETQSGEPAPTEAKPESRPKGEPRQGGGGQRREPREPRGDRGPRPQREGGRDNQRGDGGKGGGDRRGPRPGGGGGGDRRDFKGGRPDLVMDIDLEKLIADSLYLDNQAHAVVSRMRDMDSGTRSQLRRLYSAIRRACRAAEGDRQHQFVMLRARLAYTIARHQLRSLDGLEKLLLQVTRKNDARGYERFRDLFEAIVAYNE